MSSPHSRPSASEPATRRKPGPMPGTDAARRGGTAARDKLGAAFYARIGAKGGKAVHERHGSTFYSEIGRKGGEATKRAHGSEYYARIGRIGGTRAHGQRTDPGVERHGGHIWYRVCTTSTPKTPRSLAPRSTHGMVSSD